MTQQLYISTRATDMTTEVCRFLGTVLDVRATLSFSIPSFGKKTHDPPLYNWVKVAGTIPAVGFSRPFYSPIRRELFEAKHAQTMWNFLIAFAGKKPHFRSLIIQAGLSGPANRDILGVSCLELVHVWVGLYSYFSIEGSKREANQIGGFPFESSCPESSIFFCPFPACGKGSLSKIKRCLSLIFNGLPPPPYTLEFRPGARESTRAQTRSRTRRHTQIHKQTQTDTN